MPLSPAVDQGWSWQPGWEPRQAPAFNAQWADRWLAGTVGDALPDLLLDPRWDPSCRWVPKRSPVVSCGWESLLLDDQRMPVAWWVDRLGERCARRWSTFPGPAAQPQHEISHSWLDVVLSDAPCGGWPGVDPVVMARRVALVHALGAQALDQGTPDPGRPGWVLQADPLREGLLNRTVAHGALYPLAHALLDLGASLAVRRADGRSDADEWLDQVGRLPGNEEVRAHWPALLVRGLCTVPPGPEWTAWKQSGRRGIVQRCVIEAAQAVEARTLHRALPGSPSPARPRSRL